MNLKITKNIKEANLVTHTSTFHPDDVFSTMFLSKIIENPIVCRTSSTDEAEEDAIIYDIGFGKFDHHGPTPRKRTNNLTYCSFGLIWDFYGRDYLKTLNPIDVEKLWQAIDQKLVMQIDGIDNGVFPKINAPYYLSDLDKIIDLFNKAWNEEVDNDDNFLLAVSVAEQIFDRLIVKENARLKANIIVEEQINNVKDNILILKDYLPYEDAMWGSENPKANEIKAVIYPSSRGGWSIKPRTVAKDSKELAYKFPEEFLGMHDEELVKKSKIKTARFVHSGGFIACASTLEDAILLAETAIKNGK